MCVYFTIEISHSRLMALFPSFCRKSLTYGLHVDQCREWDDELILRAREQTNFIYMLAWVECFSDAVVDNAATEYSPEIMHASRHIVDFVV